MGNKIIIVGGVAGGASAAARLRRLDERSSIILVERGEYISFANCGLPYYIGETIQERSKLLVQTVPGLSSRYQLDVRNLSEVTSIQREEKQVTIKNLRTGDIYTESYDYLILSPGAKPMVPDIPGLSESRNVFTLRNIPDTDRIKQYIEKKKPKQAVIVGGGFIGLEMAENLAEQGIQVTLIEMANQVMAPLDYEMASIVHSHLMEQGVRLILEDGVRAFHDGGSRIELSSGQLVSTDMTFLSIGVRPENVLAVESGLQVNERGGIRVNAHMQTSDPHIYAIGDAIEVNDYIHQSPAIIPLAGPANRQGRLVADHIYGKSSSYKGTLGSSIAKVFELTVAATGSNEKRLKQMKIPYQAIHIHPLSHAGYYPGAYPISLKLLFHPESGQIYGAQAVGADGVDKRIDVIATAIKGNLNVWDLTEVELSYAPPYSSAKDPINYAGYVASNILDGLVETVQWFEMNDLVSSGATLIDVREPSERGAGYIEGSINIPLNDLRSRLKDLPQNETLYVTCQVGLRGYLAARILTEHGFRVKNLDGGWKTYASVYKPS
ncbi:CoA-disulfide reductase [Paenibacillus glucanolyticus]|uniref:CoA-disulfide reductase n=1 Tax=Paenibacillus glucanolyticus TaxID=59843 RepID=UPI00096C6918|nr:CoA-disulfide reductase [Paenibacillus glucanolyticus]OMF66064.1 CoA-disulfide reductase [Paenibacillus glucanolyticus]